MKLLFDQNLPPRLERTLVDLFPGSRHVGGLGLDRASDSEIWTFARGHGFTIVTKDTDFEELNVVLGFPPKTVLIRGANRSTGEVEKLLRERYPAILAHRENKQSGTLVLL